MNYKDIPKFTQPARYQVNSSWRYLEEMLARYNERSTEGLDGLDLNPDFQRGHVWSTDKQIAYVEFCLKGGQSSREILFNHPNWEGNMSKDSKPLESSCVMSFLFSMVTTSMTSMSR